MSPMEPSVLGVDMIVAVFHGGILRNQLCGQPDKLP